VYTERNRIGPLTSTSSWRVEEVDAERGFQRHVSAPSPGIRGFAVLCWVEATETGSRYRIELQAEVAAGPLSPILATVLRRSLASSKARSVANFATLLQQEAQPAVPE
jgi:hypothetical protein